MAVTIAPEPPDSAVAAALLGAYRGELGERFPGGFQPPPGCGAVRVLEPGIAELKHMWVSPGLRGRGAGRGLLAALEEAARDLGCLVVRLDTSAYLPEAVALYRSVGYGEIPRYNDNPISAIWMERAFGEPAAHSSRC